MRQQEQPHPCYEVSWEGEATIDGHSAIRRHYRAFTDPEAAKTLIEGDHGEACRLIDRSTGEAVLVQATR